MTNDPAPHRDDVEVPGLDELDPADRRRVTELGRLVTVPPGWSMVRRGEPADEAWLVVDGTVRVDVDGEHLADVGPGGFVGEMGLVDERLRNARVTTLGEVTALAFPKTDFTYLRKQIPAFDEVVSRSAAWRHSR